MKEKRTIGTMLLNGKLLYSFTDTIKALDFKSIEAALRNVSADSVYTIENGEQNAEKFCYIDAKGLYALLINSPHPLLAISHDQEYELVEPKCMKDNLAVNGITYYPAQVMLNITVNANSEMDAESDIREEYLFSVSEIAEEFGITARKLNLFLEMKGIQHRKGNRWYIYKKYLKKGYVGFKKHKIGHMYWTTDGMLFIITMLNKAGYKRIHDDR